MVVSLLEKKQGLQFDIFRSYTSVKDTRGVIKTLEKYGSEEPQLYPAALAYFTSDSKILEEAREEIDFVLKKIDKDRLMAPLQVIQTLSTNAVATMGMVKDYLQQTIERERKEIASNRRLIESYRSETFEKRKEISDLSNKPQIFNNTRCQFCGLQLSLPTVHFLCKHSFHQTCLNLDIEPDGSIEGSCPSCKKDNDTIRAIRKAQVRLQLAGEGARTSTKASPLSITREIITNGKVLDLYTGLSAGLLRQAVYTTARLGIFDTIMKNLTLRSSRQGKSIGFKERAGAGLTAGGLAAILGNPADLALIRMQQME
ncbi:unnamed protein product [Trifolium pratense]|uniref:Uncharacterized protein n=1 Tax=Trifolium pratense TaxID=57577 RepID=A0ACB0K410_TRIPR|nr:unnamed protein product [Trifolium pratense]